MACKSSQIKLAFILFIFVQLAASNPIDLDPLGLFGSSADDSSSANANANSISDNSIVSGKGSSHSRGGSLSAGTADAFAVDKNLHIPDPILGSGGLNADLSLAGAKSFSISKGSDGDETVIILPPTPRPFILPPRPPPINPPHPPPPPPKPYYHDNYQPHGKYNVHDLGSRPNNHY